MFWPANLANPLPARTTLTQASWPRLSDPRSKLPRAHPRALPNRCSTRIGGRFFLSPQVPVVDKVGPSGSIVFRTINTVVPPETVAKELRKRARE